VQEAADLRRHLPQPLGAGGAAPALPGVLAFQALEDGTDAVVNERVVHLQDWGFANLSVARTSAWMIPGLPAS
jgi:hypothetical protein